MSANRCNGTAAQQGSSGVLKHEYLFSEVTKMVREYLVTYKDRSSKVVEFRSPEEVRAAVDLELREEGMADEELLKLCRKVLELSVHTGERGHPHTLTPSLPHPFTPQPTLGSTTSCLQVWMR